MQIFFIVLSFFIYHHFMINEKRSEHYILKKYSTTSVFMYLKKIDKKRKCYSLFFFIAVFYAQIAPAQNIYNENDVNHAKKPFYLSIKSSKPIPLYEKNNDKSAIISQMPPNAVAIEYVGCKNLKEAKNVYVKRTQGKRGWCQIIYLGKHGWVQKQFLQKYIIPEKNIFDCGANIKGIDRFICDDAELLTLANQLNDVYNHSEQKAKNILNPHIKPLQELQKSHALWKSSKNYCNNHNDYYEKHDCLTQLYKLRITYLQTKWLLVSNAESVHYVCGKDKFIITKFLTELFPSVIVQNSKKSEVMIDYVNDIENIYFGDNGLFMREIGDDITLKWHNQNHNSICKNSTKPLDQTHLQ